MKDEILQESQFKLYIEAAVNLYGVIHIQNVIELFKYYEDTEYTRSQLGKLMEEHFHHHDVIHIYNGFIYSSSIFKDKNDAIQVYQSEKKKPYYQPDKTVFMNYLNEDYYDENKSYEPFKLFLYNYSSNINVEDKELYLDKLIRKVNKMIHRNCSINNVMSALLEYKIDINNEHTMKVFGNLLMDVYNNTRMIHNHGFTPLELRERHKK